jgi:hypothetical protein
MFKKVWRNSQIRITLKVQTFFPIGWHSLKKFRQWAEQAVVTCFFKDGGCIQAAIRVRMAQCSKFQRICPYVLILYQTDKNTGSQF